MTEPQPTGGNAAGSGPPPDGPLDFDPYRFGAPEHPIPPEYAPPGYRPPAPAYPQPPYALPPSYAPTPPPYSREYPPATGGNGKATAALVLGIVSIPLCFLTFVDLIPIVLAIVFGIIGRNEAKRWPGRGGRSSATAGLVCAIIGAVLAATLTVLVYTRLRPCLNEVHNTSAYQSCVRSKL